MNARWTAYRNGNETIILRNGRRWGELVQGNGFAVARPVMRPARRFEGQLATDKAWGALLPDPLPTALAWDLQDQAAANVLERAS